MQNSMVMFTSSGLTGNNLLQQIKLKKSIFQTQMTFHSLKNKTVEKRDITTYY